MQALVRLPRPPGALPRSGKPAGGQLPSAGMQTAQQACPGRCGPATAWACAGRRGNCGGVCSAAPDRLHGRLHSRLHGCLHGRLHGCSSFLDATRPHGRAARAIATAAARRDVLAIGALSLLGPEVAPQRGDCPTCIGEVDDTLGSCASAPSCLSSYDDRPGHFITPWEYSNGSRRAAMEKLVDAVQTVGGLVQDRTGDEYLYVIFPSEQGLFSALAATDDVEFLLPDDNDVRVEIRSASRQPSVPDGGRQERRLELIRSVLGWELLPVIRNRQRLFKVIESPWDSFGPTPPAGIEYGGRVFRDNGTPD